MSRPLDNRRVNQVKPRGVRAEDGENYALDNFAHRVSRRRLVEIIGEEAVAADEKAKANRGKVKCADCPAMIAYTPAFNPDRCQRCAILAGDRETAELQRGRQ